MDPLLNPGFGDEVIAKELGGCRAKGGEIEGDSVGFHEVKSVGSFESGNLEVLSRG